MTLTIGKLAPEFKLEDQDGQTHSLKYHRGRWVLIYFYPKDMTPGCTKEACAVQVAFPKFKKLKAQVFGVSVDSVASHKKFVTAYKLKFPLLADVEKEAVTAYGVWGKKKFMGREYMGTKRMSFLIDPKGRLRKIYETVKPAEHANEVLADLVVFQKEKKV